MTPRRLGPYELEQLLGSGSMGEVYLARDSRHHDRRVAVKLLPESLSADREFMVRFEREARITAQLSEPHVIPVHSYGVIEGRPYIEMRLVQGSDLHRLLSRSGPLPPGRAVSLVAQAAAALDAAHAEGLVHRDVKPSNMVVTPQDFLYVVDFGIARASGTSNTALTGTGVAIGTLQYMAPERFLGQDLDARTDLYSLTCVLVECLTGAPPFRGEELPALLYAHISLDPPQLSRFVPGIPAQLDDVVARGMAKDPADRFPTAGELVAAATEALQGHRPAPATVVRRDDEATVNGLSTTAPRRDRPPVPVPADGGPDRSHAAPARTVRRTALTAAGVLALVAAIVLALVYLPDREDDAVAGGPGAPPSRSSSASSSSSAAPLPSVRSPVPAGQITERLDNPHDIALSPDGTRAYVADADAGLLQVIDLGQQAVVDSIPIPQGPPQYVTLSPEDDSTAYVTTSQEQSTDLYFLVVDLAGRTVRESTPVDRYPLKPTVSPDGALVYVPLHDMGQVEVFNADGLPITRFSVPENPHSIAISADGETGYVANHESNAVTAWDLRDLRDVRQVGDRIGAGTAPHRLALSPDGQQLAVVNFRSHDVWLYPLADPSNPQKVGVGNNPQDVAFAPDGRHLYTVNLDDDSLSVVDTQTLQVVRVPVGNQPTSIVLRADGSQAFVTVSEPPDDAAPERAGMVAVLDTAG
ncbi:hypothetical protein GCM10027261_04870 [Geodermatophilus arenarius]|uniref:non-specific serine/threonine protein kinase n=1 Tax=Geodermatophilus arenarius TaxID=1137990 RepID=A0ABV9LF74_9ACTN